MKLEYPLNDSLPEIEHSRDRLLARLHRFRQDTTVSRLTTDEDYALLYAYGMFASSSFPYKKFLRYIGNILTIVRILCSSSYRTVGR